MAVNRVVTDILSDRLAGTRDFFAEPLGFQVNFGLDPNGLLVDISTPV